MTNPRTEREDRHGDHWAYTGRDRWQRVEPPHLMYATAGLERDYGPTREGHGPDCIRPRIAEMNRMRAERGRG